MEVNFVPGTSVLAKGLGYPGRISGEEILNELEEAKGLPKSKYEKAHKEVHNA